jgi:hypothetical protein
MKVSFHLFVCCGIKLASILVFGFVTVQEVLYVLLCISFFFVVLNMFEYIKMNHTLIKRNTCLESFLLRFGFHIEYLSFKKITG